MVALVEGFEDAGEDGGVLAAGGADGDALARVEEGVRGDGGVDFRLEGAEEAGPAELAVVFGPEDERARGVAALAGCGGHGWSRMGDGGEEGRGLLWYGGGRCRRLGSFSDRFFGAVVPPPRVPSVPSVRFRLSGGGCGPLVPLFALGTSLLKSLTLPSRGFDFAFSAGSLLCPAYLLQPGKLSQLVALMIG